MVRRCASANLYTNTTSVVGPHSVKYYNELLWGSLSASKGEGAEGGCSFRRNRWFGDCDMTNCGGDYSDLTRDTAAYGGTVKATNMSLYRWLPSSETGDSP